MSRLRVGLNLLFLKPGQVGGTEEYVRRLLGALGSEARDEVEMTLFVNGRFPPAHPELTTAHRTVVAPISGDWPPLRIAAESSWLVAQTSRGPFDLVHHAGNTIPHVRNRPVVVTIHDLQPIVRPRDFGPVKGTYLRARLRHAARRARVITTPSDHVRRSLIDRFGLGSERVVVVPAPIPSPTAEDGPRSPSADGIESPYFVYPAITHPHKNHLTLIRAFARVAALHPEASLVLTGGKGAAERAVLDETGRLRLGDRVRRVGLIPRGDLDMLLRRATALTFPSHHEGFGMPLAEAMALGCPVIASDATALPEVLGGAGLLVDPDDVDGWVGAMLRLLEDDTLRQSLVSSGRERVGSLAPAEIARRLVEAYRLAVGGRG